MRRPKGILTLGVSYDGSRLIVYVGWWNGAWETLSWLCSVLVEQQVLSRSDVVSSPWRLQRSVDSRQWRLVERQRLSVLLPAGRYQTTSAYHVCHYTILLQAPIIENLFWCAASLPFFPFPFSPISPLLLSPFLPSSFLPLGHHILGKRLSSPHRGELCYQMTLMHFRLKVLLMRAILAHLPLFPRCPFTSSSFPPFYFCLSFIGFTYFLLLSIPSLSTRIVPLRFQAGGRRRRPNLG